jgi:ring-1,2-phenylacetyl-CoA epoxidase subunit PaaC
MALKDLIYQLADNAMINGQRLGEWCGHGPILEQDMALTNMALDHFGLSRYLFQYLAESEGLGKTEDDYAFLRDAWDFKNILLVELPNGDFGQTILKQFFFDNLNFHYYTALQQSKDRQLAEIAQKAIKEMTYHLRFSSEWVVRLGDGTEESHTRMQNAMDFLWEYTGELTLASKTDIEMAEKGIAPDLSTIAQRMEEKTSETIQKAGLAIPETPHMQSGGKVGKHTEHLGFILSDMQFMQRAYPNLEW